MTQLTRERPLQVRGLVRGGDHVVLVCDVLASACGDGAPLVHHDRVFGSHLRA